MSLKVLSKYLDDLSKREIDLLTECRDIQEVKNLLNHFGYSLDEEQLEEIRLSYSKEYDSENNGNTLSMSQLEQVAGGKRVKAIIGRKLNQAIDKGNLRMLCRAEGAFFGNCGYVLVEDGNILTNVMETETPEVTEENYTIPDYEQLAYNNASGVGVDISHPLYKWHEAFSHVFSDAPPDKAKLFLYTDEDSVIFVDGDPWQTEVSCVSETNYLIFSKKALENIYKSLPKGKSFYFSSGYGGCDNRYNHMVPVIGKEFSREEAAIYTYIALNNHSIGQYKMSNSDTDKQTDSDSDTDNQTDSTSSKNCPIYHLTSFQVGYFMEKYPSGKKTFLKMAIEADDMSSDCSIVLDDEDLLLPYRSKGEILSPKYPYIASNRIFRLCLEKQQLKSQFFEQPETQFFEQQETQFEQPKTQFFEQQEPQFEQQESQIERRAIGQTVGAGIGFGVFAPLGIIALSVEPVKAFVAASIAAPISHAISFLSISAVSIGLPVFSIILGIGFFLGFGIYAYKNFGALRAIRDKSSETPPLLQNSTNFNGNDDWPRA